MGSAPSPGLVFPGTNGTGLKRRLIVVSVLLVVFFAVLGGVLYYFIGGESNAVKKSANEFAAALVANDPSAAPKGGAEFVADVHKRFGRVGGARIVRRDNVSGKDNSHFSSGGNSSHWNVDIFLRTHRGPALIRVAYKGGNLNPKDADIDDVLELRPGEIPSSDLSDADERAVAVAFATRHARCVRRAGDDVFKKSDCDDRL